MQILDADLVWLITFSKYLRFEVCVVLEGEGIFTRFCLQNNFYEFLIQTHKFQRLSFSHKGHKVTLYNISKLQNNYGNFYTL